MHFMKPFTAKGFAHLFIKRYLIYNAVVYDSLTQAAINHYSVATECNKNIFAASNE
jgi:hypothetical protein